MRTDTDEPSDAAGEDVLPYERAAIRPGIPGKIFVACLISIYLGLASLMYFLVRII
jgi:hypothetical protein